MTFQHIATGKERGELTPSPRDDPVTAQEIIVVFVSG